MPSLIYQLLIKKIQTRTSETVVKDHFLLIQKMEGDSEFISARLLAHDARSGYQDARSCGGKNKSSIWYYVTVLISTNDFRSVVLSAWYEIWPALKKNYINFYPIMFSVLLLWHSQVSLTLWYFLKSTGYFGSVRNGGRWRIETSF